MVDNQNIDALLHELWGKATNQSDYNKKLWIALQREIELLQQKVQLLEVENPEGGLK